MDQHAPRFNYDLAVKKLLERRQKKILAARHFIAWVDKAIFAAVLKPGPALQKKLNETSNARLELEKTDYHELQREYYKLDAEYSRLEWEWNKL